MYVSYNILQSLSSLLLAACGLALFPTHHRIRRMASNNARSLVACTPGPPDLQGRLVQIISTRFRLCYRLVQRPAALFNGACSSLLDPRSVEIFRRSVELQKSTTFLSTQQIRAQGRSSAIVYSLVLVPAFKPEG